MCQLPPGKPIIGARLVVPLQLPVTSRQRENVATIIVVTSPGNS